MPDLVIRFPVPDDAPAVAEAVGESLAELGQWMPWAHPAYAIPDALEWITAQAAGRADGSAFEFLVCDARGGLLGACGINCINKGNRFANLGYWVRTSATRRGVAVGAVALVAAWSFEHTDLVRLEIVAAVGNLASRRVAEKAGALREGTLRSRLSIHGRPHDAVIYSLIRPPGVSRDADGARLDA
ncbi:MAG TPA: GNAT family N-acetyltransferase [Thermoanaerobaculaceae bacterium]|nr:GNAT family N-acetyltransferase [Thermoanaerobaculaceae bacterium]